MAFLIIGTLERDEGMVVGTPDYPHSSDCCCEGRINLRSIWNRKFECSWHGIYMSSLGTAAVLEILPSFPSFPYQLLIFHVPNLVSSYPSGMDHAVIFSASFQSQLSQIKQPSG